MYKSTSRFLEGNYLKAYLMSLNGPASRRCTVLQHRQAGSSISEQNTEHQPSTLSLMHRLGPTQKISPLTSAGEAQVVRPCEGVVKTVPLSAYLQCKSWASPPGFMSICQEVLNFLLPSSNWINFIGLNSVNQPSNNFLFCFQIKKRTLHIQSTMESHLILSI